VDNDPVDLEKKAEMLILNPEIMEKLSRELIRMRPQHTWSERAKTVYLALQPPSGTIL
jgi:glycosyltransferase involved in cell wall biosynthesis